MKKILIGVFLLAISLSSQSSLPKKYVKIAYYDDGVVYGNIEDNYINSQAWIVTNFSNGQSKIERYSANCSNNSISSSNVVFYQKRDLKGKVLNRSNIGNFNSKVIPDTVGEAIFEFLCYGMY